MSVGAWEGPNERRAFVSAAMASAPGVTAGDSVISFAVHQVRAGEDGARDDFQQLIAQLVRAVSPGARVIAANPGDWGIDVVVGSLGGRIAVWQSKYFFPKTTKSHQHEIRTSFDSVLKSAAREGHVVKQWTLCIPSSMDGPTTKWWDGWKLRKQREHGLEICLWDETELRGLLITPDASDVFRYFFGPRAPAREPELAPIDVPDDAVERLDHALFVRQLRAAGHVEVSSAKKQYFNADLMAREIVDKGVPTEVGALNTADAVVQSIWEDRYNEACGQTSGPMLPGLHSSVMKDIRDQHKDFASRLPGGLIHSRGLMHRVVDDRRAGWTTTWKQVVDVHLDEVAAHLQPGPAGISVDDDLSRTEKLAE